MKASSGQLSKLLRFAAEDDEDEGHEHLMKECSWYRAVLNGESAVEPAGHCKSRGTVKLTPRTPEASTVPQPTVPPGGPGLFHVKGLELPPYIQHLYKHLVARYGRHKAYGVAVGIVKKWAAGINPGGWKTKSGKGRRTHADVRAAAARNIAEWEADRAKAHAQHAKTEAREHAKTTAAAGGVALTARSPGAAGTPRLASTQAQSLRRPCFDPLAMGSTRENLAVSLAAAFPGDREIPLPPVPHDKTAAAMFTAHRVGDIINQMSHAAERVVAAAKAPADLRRYHSVHIANHATMATRSAHQMLDNMRRNYPAEQRELDKLNEVVGFSVSLSPRAKVASFAHLMQTVCYNLGHAKRHADALLDDDPSNEALWRFNLDHASRHINGTMEHALKLAEHLRDNYPAEAHWLTVLEGYQGREAAEKGKPEGAAEQVARKGGGKADAYDRKPKATIKLVMPAATAPGAKPVQPNQAPPDYGLHRKPYFPAGAPIALPPGARLPAPAEILQLARMVPDCSDASLAASCRKHLETVAGMLRRGAVLDALHLLRTAQQDAFAGHKADLGAYGQSYYTANVFARTVPPAEASSAQSGMLQSQQRRMEWRKLQQGINLAIDKIRRNFFHGQLGSWNTQARFAQDETGVTLAARLR